MKAFSVRELKNNPSVALRAAREHPVIVLNRHQPEAVLIHLDDESLLPNRVCGAHWLQLCTVTAACRSGKRHGSRDSGRLHSSSICRNLASRWYEEAPLP